MTECAPKRTSETRAVPSASASDATVAAAAESASSAVPWATPSAAASMQAGDSRREVSAPVLAIALSIAMVATSSASVAGKPRGAGLGAGHAGLRDSALQRIGRREPLVLTVRALVGDHVRRELWQLQLDGRDRCGQLGLDLADQLVDGRLGLLERGGGGLGDHGTPGIRNVGNSLQGLLQVLLQPSGGAKGGVFGTTGPNPAHTIFRICL